MGEGDGLLIVVVAVAFIVGFSIVSFVIKRLMAGNQPAEPTRNPAPRDERAPQTPAPEPGGTAANEAAKRADQLRQWEEEQARRRNKTW